MEDTLMDLVPVAEATVPLKATRERIIRRIQSGSLKGTFRNGRWLVARSEIETATPQR